MKETLDKRLAETTQKTINFLNTLLEEQLKIVGIENIITVITWGRKVIGKRHHVESVQAKEDPMLQHVKSFKALFSERTPLFLE